MDLFKIAVLVGAGLAVTSLIKPTWVWPLAPVGLLIVCLALLFNSGK